MAVNLLLWMGETNKSTSSHHRGEKMWTDIKYTGHAHENSNELETVGTPLGLCRMVTRG